MRRIVKKLVSPVLQKISAVYFRKPRSYRFKEISVLVYPGVFPPHMTISTKILLNHIDAIDLAGKHILELGCGSGIISILAAKKGAFVTASDINDTALTGLRENAQKNSVAINIVRSDLFENLQDKTFDLVIINPPYYPKQPKNIAESAWFCGANFEYFERLFAELASHLQADGNLLMILSEDCDRDRILKIAHQNNLLLKQTFHKIVAGENNFIYAL